ncbi:Gmad2 immunoglobulin-like domain-containing protein [Rhabdothermincola salaria]|uniref:Gmad2 immunoglobulin-like domain-containing protein n=1 Tax=Rhabdothermincola salaria TaxID=2903142 RepID=UPI001E47B3CB|nr:Gmad2 immunoglobulin-like domain-containing protein [Rhabdothermincola salaria]MCD9625688.1 GerMN domain-containing protein [Rhabdothermincola salaria]
MRTRLGILTVFVLVVALGACGGDDQADESASTSTTAGVGTTASTTTTTSDEGDGPMIDVRVYFTRDEAVATAGRTVEGPEVGRGAMDALLDGPEGIETEIGFFTAIPEGTELLDLDIADGVATVDLSSEFESGGGSLSMQARVAQVVFTLTQFDTVDTVQFRLDGQPVEAIGGEGVLVDGVDRSDFANVTPMVLVESPVPGDAVASPLEITGMANTFEGTVQYVVTDGDGLIVAEGFTTATAGMGTFGTFSVTATFEVPTPGIGSVIGFETSARDGSQINVYEVPVEIG